MKRRLKRFEAMPTKKSAGVEPPEGVQPLQGVQHLQDKLTAEFLESLSETLDVDQTVKKLNITKEDARDILRGLAIGKRPPKAAPVHVPVKKGVEHLEGAKPLHGVYHIYVDGASRGNPGKAGAGAAIKDAEGTVVRKLKSYLGILTNNMAEYSAMIMALKAARDMGIKDVRIYADSELMVKQLNGVYRVKSHDLMPLFLEATHLLGAFDEYKIAHVYREGNGLADSLANEAIDQRG